MTRRSKFVTTLALGVMLAGVAVAQRGDDADRKSKNGRAEGTVNGVGVVVEYGRPNANGREIWGGLVPHGKVWRTGANEATTITFDRDVTVGGTAVPAGTYALFTIPGESDCKVIVNSVAAQWGAFDHDPSKDVASTVAAAKPIEHVETFEISVGDDGVTLAWADRAFTFEIGAAAAP